MPVTVDKVVAEVCVVGKRVVAMNGELWPEGVSSGMSEDVEKRKEGVGEGTVSVAKVVGSSPSGGFEITPVGFTGGNLTAPPTVDGKIREAVYSPCVGVIALS